MGEVDVAEASFGAFAGTGSSGAEVGSNKTGTVRYVMVRLPPTNNAENVRPRCPAIGMLSDLSAMFDTQADRSNQRRGNNERKEQGLQ